MHYTIDLLNYDFVEIDLIGQYTKEKNIDGYDVSDQFFAYKIQGAMNAETGKEIEITPSLIEKVEKELWLLDIGRILHEAREYDLVCSFDYKSYKDYTIL